MPNASTVVISKLGTSSVSNASDTIRLKEYKKSFKTGDIRSKLVHYAVETDQMPNFEVTTALASGVNR